MLSNSLVRHHTRASWMGVWARTFRLCLLYLIVQCNHPLLCKASICTLSVTILLALRFGNCPKILYTVEKICISKLIWRPKWSTIVADQDHPSRWLSKAFIYQHGLPRWPTKIVYDVCVPRWLTKTKVADQDRGLYKDYLPSWLTKMARQDGLPRWL